MAAYALQICYIEGEESESESEESSEQSSEESAERTKHPSRNARRKKHKRQLKRLGLLKVRAPVPPGRDIEQEEEIPDPGLSQQPVDGEAGGTDNTKRRRVEEEPARFAPSSFMPRDLQS